MLAQLTSKKRAFAHFRSFEAYSSCHRSAGNPTHFGPVDWFRTQVDRHFGGEICCWSSQRFSLQSSSSSSVPECPVS